MSSSLTETSFIPPALQAQGLTRCFIYSGPSMMPGFRPGHLLYVRPAARDIQPGDVVVFTHSDGVGFVTHRVVSVTDAGFVTRGDNNVRADTTPVPADAIVGRVEMVDANGTLEPVRGGAWGLWTARLAWYARRASAWLRQTFGGPYRWLRRSGLVARVWHPRITQLCVNTDNGALVKYICNGRVVARWWQQHHRFECAKPYDLVIARPDENSG